MASRPRQTRRLDGRVFEVCEAFSSNRKANAEKRRLKRAGVPYVRVVAVTSGWLVCTRQGADRDNETGQFLPGHGASRPRQGTPKRASAPGGQRRTATRRGNPRGTKNPTTLKLDTKEKRERRKKYWAEQYKSAEARGEIESAFGLADWKLKQEWARERAKVRAAARKRAKPQRRTGRR